MSMRLANVLLGVGFVAFAIYVYAGAQAFDPRAARLPIVLAVVFIVLGLLIAAVNVYPRTGRVRAKEMPFAGVPWWLWFYSIAALVMFAIAVGKLGFYSSAVLYITAMTMVLSSGEGLLKRILVSVAFAVASTAVLYGLFSLVLSVPVPHNVLLF